MSFIELQKKGLSKFLIGDDLDSQKLSMHISEVEPGNRSHAAHTHQGMEAFYVFEGQATVEFEGKHYPLNANESMVIDATVPHGIFNSGTVRTKYLVVVVK
jgi:mannose-6-phosphate isomerase-like protein (cupin superfamily)